MNRNDTFLKRPDREELLRAAEIYIAHAYSGPAPDWVNRRLRSLAQQEQGALYESAEFEHPASAATRYSLRLGNHFYPHMKLVIDRTPDGRSYMYRADTHDRHCCPPAQSSEFRIFSELMERNQNLARDIEQACESAGLPTFKNYLRNDLAKRQTPGETGG